MPGPHRRFLERVAEIANIRGCVTAHPDDSALQAAYNQCLEALVAFRNKHVQIVSRYIVVQSRIAQSEQEIAMNGANTSLSTKDGSVQPALVAKAVLGTGGTSPVVFLKQVRDETKECLFIVKSA